MSTGNTSDRRRGNQPADRMDQAPSGARPLHGQDAPAPNPAQPRPQRGDGGAGSGGFGVVDRRTGLDRRAIELAGKAGMSEGDVSTGLERRRGPGRRRSDFAKSAEEGEMTREQFLFLMAIDAFKRSNDRMYPTWTDVLEVVRMLGYRKTMPSELNLKNAEDWTESPNSPANTRTITGQPREAA